MRPPLVLALLALLPTACERAQRYSKQSLRQPEPIAEKPVKDEKPKPDTYDWLPTTPMRDIPILFVSDSSPAWEKLPTYWNHSPPPPAGVHTIHVGQTPLVILAGLILTDMMQEIRIKVPRGLPDPSAGIPAANAPSYARWQLGKTLFFDPSLMRHGADTVGCRNCHRPEQAFSSTTYSGQAKVPSLINSAYNKHQFADGRARALEEILEEFPLADRTKKPAFRHDWTEVVEKVYSQPNSPKLPDYPALFEAAFGVRRPTRDTLVKALANYMRTLLVGDALFDRAWDSKKQAKAPELGFTHFREHLDGAALLRLEQPKDADKDKLARNLEHGYLLFKHHAGCAACHPAPLFSDHDFHNIGTDYAELGRFARVPLGLKENRLLGAIKTPTLRNLPAAGPYFHDSGKDSLEGVLAYFDSGVKYSQALAAPLCSGPDEARRLGLSADDHGHLLLFLRSLRGTPIDPILIRPPYHRE